MQPLLKIETVPISIEYVEKPKYHAASKTAQLQVSQDSANVNIKSDPIRISAVDQYDFHNSGDSATSYTATAGFIENGILRLNVRMAQGMNDDSSYERSNRSIENMMDALPERRPWKPQENSFHINFHLGDMGSLLNRTGSNSYETTVTSFLPPDLEVKVVQRPKVVIKYIGGPIYIPKSSDPNYEPPEEVFLIGDGKSNFDVKA